MRLQSQYLGKALLEEVTLQFCAEMTRRMQHIDNLKGFPRKIVVQSDQRTGLFFFKRYMILRIGTWIDW